MKKSLVLAMAMALGVTASAYAANPFSDVPAGHWAYDSISKLAAAGVIEGYGDTTFGGDKLMTRYEMAQIVAKAMAKGANVDKLAAEFADELDNLGVRVANLEKKADNVKITGELRFRYVNQDGAMINKNFGDRESLVIGNASNHVADLRSRIWINGMINDDWTYTGMLENTQDLSDNAGNEDTKFQRAYVDGKLGGMAVRAGRYNLVIADGNIYDTRADGLELSYGNKLKLKGFAGKATDDITVVPVMISDEDFTGDITNGGKYWGLAVEGELAKGLMATAGYTQFKDMGTGFAESHGGAFGKTDIDNGIWHAGLSYDIGHFNLSAMYLKGDLSADKINGMTDGNQVNRAIDQYLDDDGFVIGLSYKGAKAEDAGSWGAWAKYYDQGAQTYVAHTTDANTFGMTGFKGFGVGANYTIAKNIVANVAYYNTESKLAKALGAADELDRTKDHRFWTDVTFTF